MGKTEKPEDKGKPTFKSPKNLASVNFFSQEIENVRSKLYNKKRKEMLKILLQVRDEDGNLRVDINNGQRNNNLSTATEKIDASQ